MFGVYPQSVCFVTPDAKAIGGLQLVKQLLSYTAQKSPHYKKILPQALHPRGGQTKIKY